MPSENDLKHQDAINSIFEMMFESWMDENDKQEFITLMLKQADKTLAELDRDIEIGVEKGYPVEQQITILKQQLGTTLKQ